MADNENEGSNRFRQNQGSKKRREPPIIDSTATDVSDVGAPADEEATTSPVSDADAHGAQTGPEVVEEPVLFGQVLRGSSSATAEAGDETTSLPVDAVPSTTGDTTESVPPNDAAGAFPQSDQTEGLATPSASPEPNKSTEELDAAIFGSTAFGGEPPAKTEDPAFIMPPPQRSPVTLILGGVAVVLLLAIAGMLFADLQKSGTDDIKTALDAANARIAALEARPDPAPLNSKIAQIDQRSSDFAADLAAVKQTAGDLVKRLGDVATEAQANAAAISSLAPQATPAPPTNAAPAMAPAADLSGLASRIDDLSHKVETLPAGTADLGPLQSKVAELSQRLDALPNGTTAAVDLAPVEGKLTDLSQRLDALQTTVAALPKTDLGPIEAQTAGQTKRIDGLDQGLNALAASVAALPKVDLDPLRTDIAGVKQRLTPLEAAMATPKAGDQATEDRAVGSADVSRAAPLAVVAQTIGRRIDDGRPMVSEVAALRSLGVEDATLAPLDAVAEKGAPTAASLKAQWADLEPAVTATVRPATGNSLLDKFAAGARQIIVVRRVGASTAEDPASLIARIPAALDDGDVAGALADWAKLPDVARGASQTWADAARSRLDAEAAAQSLASRAIDTLAKAKG